MVPDNINVINENDKEVYNKQFSLINYALSISQLKSINNISLI